MHCAREFLLFLTPPLALIPLELRKLSSSYFILFLGQGNADALFASQVTTRKKQKEGIFSYLGIGVAESSSSRKYVMPSRCRKSRASLLARLPLYCSAECATPTNTSLFGNFPRNLANAPLPPESFRTCIVCATHAHSHFCSQHWLISSSSSSYPESRWFVLVRVRVA